MKRNEIVNKKLISALTLGISAMMALQTPITAYANGDIPASGQGGSEPDNTQEATAAATDNYQPVTQEAQEAADDAINACVDSDAQQTQQNPEEGAAQPATESETQDGQAEAEDLSAANAAQTAADLIIDNADSTEAGAAANEAIDNLIDAAKDVIQDSTDADGKEVNSALSDLENTVDKIEDVKKALVEADAENKKAGEAYEKVKEEATEAVEDVAALSKTADDMIDEATTAGEKATELVETIQTADTQEEAEQAYKNLEKLVDDTKSDLETRKKLYEQLAKEYDDALKELEKAKAALDEAEGKFSNKINVAENITEAAKIDVEAAQQKIENLDKALDVVQDKLSDENSANELADFKGNNWSGKFGNVDKGRAAMKNVIVNYYMKQVLGVDIIAEDVDTDRDFEAVKGVDGQEYNYHKFTYTYRDEDGNVQTGVKYFNWDSLLKTSSTDSSKFRLNSGDGIVIFEKSEDEIKANEVVKEYYKDDPVLNNNNKWKASVAGTFDVFTYFDEDGNKQYLVRDQLQNPSEGNTVGLSEDGSYETYNGHPLTKIVQNQNNLLHDGNCLIIGTDAKIDKYTSQNTEVYNTVIMNGGQRRLSEEVVNKIVADSKALNEFISTQETDNDTAALIDKYAGYKEATLAAVQEADEAVAEVENLADAIDDIKSNTANVPRTQIAKDVLGVDDIAGHYGLTVSEEDAARLNTLTVTELVTELNKLKAEADSKAEAAQDKLEEVQDKLTKATDDLKDTIDRLNPPETPTTPGGSVTPDVPSPGSETPGTEATEGEEPGSETPAPTNEDSDDSGKDAGGDESETPENPETPATPENPDTPDAPNKPENPDTPDTPRRPEKPDNAPGTDNTPSEEAGTEDAGTQDNENGGTTVIKNIEDDLVPTIATFENVRPDDGAIIYTATIAPDIVENTGTEGTVVGDFASSEVKTEAQEVGSVEEKEVLSSAPTITVKAAEKTADVVNIADEKVALAAATGQKEAQPQQSKMNWWWLLIIAIFGAFGERMYEKHLAKEEKDQEK